MLQKRRDGITQAGDDFGAGCVPLRGKRKAPEFCGVDTQRICGQNILPTINIGLPPLGPRLPRENIRFWRHGLFDNCGSGNLDWRRRCTRTHRNRPGIYQKIAGVVVTVIRHIVFEHFSPRKSSLRLRVQATQKDPRIFARAGLRVCSGQQCSRLRGRTLPNRRAY